MSKSMGSHDDLSLLFMMKVMVACHVYLFISNVFLGEILPFDNPKKNATNLLKDFLQKKWHKVVIFQGEKKINSPYLDHSF